MGLILPLNTEANHAGENIFQTYNVKTVSWGTETLAHLGPKLWTIIPEDMKSFSLSKFTQKIRKWRPKKCPCRLCKTYIKGLGFVSISDGP